MTYPDERYRSPIRRSPPVAGWGRLAGRLATATLAAAILCLAMLKALEMAGALP